MKESRFKFSHLARRRGDTHGFLSSTQQNMILVFANDGIVNGTIRLVGLEMLQIDRIVQFARKIGTARQKHGLVAIELHAINLAFVHFDIVFQMTRFGIIQSHVSIVHADKQMFIERRPPNVGTIDAFGFLGNVNFQYRIFRIVNVPHTDFGIVFHKGITNGRKSFVVFGPTNATDGSAMRKGVEAFARLDVPQFDGTV
jgi:hypothetical protein